jgi:hypothetical protein
LWVVMSYVSEENITCIFRVDERAKQETSSKPIIDKDAVSA